MHLPTTPSVFREFPAQEKKKKKRQPTKLGVWPPLTQGAMALGW